VSTVLHYFLTRVGIDTRSSAQQAGRLPVSIFMGAQIAVRAYLQHALLAGKPIVQLRAPRQACAEGGEHATSSNRNVCKAVLDLFSAHGR
jgi:hypothetical protein